MRVVVGYPPLESKKGHPFLGQNRQFQWGNLPWTAYPIVPAYLATLLKDSGFSTYWKDGIWERQTYQEWEEEFLSLDPDLLFLETKTPVIKRHWRIINRLKAKSKKLRIALFGDHVTALPEESFKKSKVDWVITGGDYDFLGLNLALHLREKEKLEPGIYCRGSGGEIKNTGFFKLNHNLDKLPLLDRDLTSWRLYAFQNSNYLRLPGSYTMFGRDCWWGKCSFCSWTTLYPGKNYRVMSVKKALAEVGHLAKNYGIREIMDDSGTFPDGDWLKEFCQGMIKKGYNQKVRISCNMRFNANLGKKDYELMRKAGFRFLLYGLESASQGTLDRLNKNLKLKQVFQALTWAKAAKLNPHLTVMVGYPWETKKEALKTLSLAKELLKKNLADTLQATIVIPYPGTPLFAQAKKKGWLKNENWEAYDMREPILKTKMSDREIKELVRDFYKSVFTLPWLIRKVKEAIFNFELRQYYLRMTFKFFSKLFDFKNN